MVRLEASSIELKREPKIVFINTDNKKIKVKLITIPHEKDVFDISKLSIIKDNENERNEFIRALETLCDEEFMSNNVLSILDNLEFKKLPDNLVNVCSKKVIKRCKDKILELGNG